MRNTSLACLLCLFLVSCTDVRNEELPQKLEQLESLKPKMEDLTADERELLAGYLIRKTFTAGMAGKDVELPAGVTIGQAIEEQRSAIEEQKAEQARQAVLQKEMKQKLEEKAKQREAQIQQLRQVVTVTLLEKAIEPEYGRGTDILLDEKLRVVFGYRNNTGKAIAGVKGMVSVKDLFGDEISVFAISNDTTIPPGQSVTWTGERSVKYAFGDDKDRKLAELESDKFKVVWEPEIIVFEDGTQLKVPAE